MRPDEHKKKKNAAYKKKHNIHTGSSKSGSTSHETDSRRVERPASDDRQQTDNTTRVKKRTNVHHTVYMCRLELELVIVLALQHIQQFTVYMVSSTWDDCSLHEQSIPIQLI